MKKLSHHARLTLITRSTKAIALTTRDNIRAYKKFNRVKRNRSRLLKTIKAPTTFLLRDASTRRKLFIFFKNIEVSLVEENHVRIDFSETCSLHPCGTLVFMSKLDMWLELYPNKLTCTYPENDVVEQLFQHVQVLHRLGLTPRKRVTHEHVSYWHFHSGPDANSATYMDLTRSVLDRIDHPAQALFADCLNEAVVNTVNHAYRFQTKNLPPKTQQKWWMFSQIKKGHLFVAIYDCGVGIPGSLRRKPEWIEYLKIRQYKDSRLIQSAIVSNRTSTLLPHRGKGLPEMLEFSSDLHAGGLSIWSGQGGVAYDAKLEVERRHKFDEPLPGTLVLWEIPFRMEQTI